MSVGSLQRICNAVLKGLKVCQNAEHSLCPGSHITGARSTLSLVGKRELIAPTLLVNTIYSFSCGPEFTEITEDAERKSS